MAAVGVNGTGYVGLVHRAVLSSLGQQVVCMDVDDLNEEKSPIDPAEQVMPLQVAR